MPTCPPALIGSKKRWWLRWLTSLSAKCSEFNAGLFMMNASLSPVLSLLISVRANTMNPLVHIIISYRRDKFVDFLARYSVNELGR